MKLRLIALAGVAALAISSPALAGSETGWYFTIGAGWDQLQDVKITSPSVPGAEDEAPFNNSAVVAGGVGYKLSSIPIRIEGEIGYDSHGINGDAVNAALTDFSGALP